MDAGRPGSFSCWSEQGAGLPGSSRCRVFPPGQPRSRRQPPAVEVKLDVGLRARARPLPPSFAMRRIFVSVLSVAAFAPTALGVGCSSNGETADASVDSYGVIVGGNDGASGDVAQGDAIAGQQTTMRLAHASPDLGPIDFCWRPSGAATFNGPVLGGGMSPPEAGAPGDAASHADASGDAGAEADATLPPLEAGTVDAKADAARSMRVRAMWDRPKRDRPRPAWRTQGRPTQDRRQGRATPVPSTLPALPTRRPRVPLVFGSDDARRAPPGRGHLRHRDRGRGAVVVRHATDGRHGDARRGQARDRRPDGARGRRLGPGRPDGRRLHRRAHRPADSARALHPRGARLRQRAAGPVAVGPRGDHRARHGDRPADGEHPLDGARGRQPRIHDASPADAPDTPAAVRRRRRVARLLDDHRARPGGAYRDGAHRHHRQPRSGRSSGSPGAAATRPRPALPPRARCCPRRTESSATPPHPRRRSSWRRGWSATPWPCAGRDRCRRRRCAARAGRR